MLAKYLRALLVTARLEHVDRSGAVAVKNRSGVVASAGEIDMRSLSTGVDMHGMVVDVRGRGWGQNIAPVDDAVKSGFADADGVWHYPTELVSACGPPRFDS